MMENVKLPCPRFEFRWTRDEEYAHPDYWWCRYSLVLPLDKYDIRRGDDEREELTIPIGKTHCGMQGEPIREDGSVDTPFRDFTHAQLDCKALGGHIPIVAVYGTVVTEVPLLRENRQ